MSPEEKQMWLDAIEMHRETEERRPRTEFELFNVGQGSLVVPVVVVKRAHFVAVEMNGDDRLNSGPRGYSRSIERFVGRLDAAIADDAVARLIARVR